jgi:hypothetical protein
MKNEPEWLAATIYYLSVESYKELTVLFSES